MCHVLIIEDEPLIAWAIETLLEDNGATSVEIADTEAEAVAAAARKHPDLITSDVTLRTGTGPAAVEAIRATLGPVPVVYITGTPNACPPPGGRDRIFGKPMDEPTIARTFRDLLAAA